MSHEEINVLYKPHNRISRPIRSKFRSNDSTYALHVTNVRRKFFEALSENSNMIFSSEHLYGISKDGLNKLASDLYEQGIDDAKVVIYFREPAALYLSGMQQRLKASSRLKDPNKYFFKYCDIVSRWLAFFDDVEVREFSHSYLVEGDVVQDFYSVVNQYFETNFKNSNEEMFRVNDSVSQQGMDILKKYRKNIYRNSNNVINDPTKKLIRIIRKCEKKSGFFDKPNLKTKVANFIRKNHAREMARLRALVGYQIFKDVEFDNGCLIDKLEFSGNLSDVLVRGEDYSEKYDYLMWEVIHTLLSDAI